MKVSVITPFKEEGGELLKEKLSRLFSGRFHDFEAIVVDDDSPFPASEVLKEFPQVKLVELKNSPPFNCPVARNAGAKEASGEFLLFTDADILFPSDMIETLLKESDGFDVIYGWTKSQNGNMMHHVTHFSLIRRDFFEYIGGFDERFAGNYGYDDVFLEWKVSRFGGRERVCDPSVVVEMRRFDKGNFDPNREALTANNLSLYQALTSSYQYVPVPKELSSHPGFLSDDDIQMLGHFSLLVKKGIVEIGSLAGKSAKVFLHFSKLPIVCIDNYGYNGVSLPISPSFPNGLSNREAREVFYKNVAEVFPDRVRHIEKLSDEAVNDLGDFPFDLLFIDGDHTYEQVKKDFENYPPKMKGGGVVLFHDYNNPDYPGVTSFVDDLISGGAERIFLTESMAAIRLKK